MMRLVVGMAGILAAGLGATAVGLSVYWHSPFGAALGTVAVSMGVVLVFEVLVRGNDA